MNIKEIKEKGKTPKRTEAHQYRNVLVPFSPFITKIFVDFNITPTFASLISIIGSVLASLLLLTGKIHIIILAFLLHHLAYLFDIVDGQVARIRNLSSIMGGYIDSLNHFFNIPIIFLCLAIGVFNATGQIIYLYLGILTSLFCRGDSKYAVSKVIIETRRRVNLKESDPLNLIAKPATGLGNGKLTKLIKSFVIFPNIIGVLLALSIIDILATKLLGIPTLTIIGLTVIGYTVCYVVLDIGEMVLDYFNKKAERLYVEYFG